MNIKSNIFAEPSLSVGDNSGAFELNLQRSTFAGTELPFVEQLLNEITDEFVFSCLWHLSQTRLSRFPKYAGFAKRNYGKHEPRWLVCSGGVVLNEPRFLKQYDPTFCLCRYGGGDDPKFFVGLEKDFPDRSIYFHDVNDEFSGRKFSMKGKLTRTLGGQSLSFVEQTTNNLSVFTPSLFVDLINKEMKPGKDAQKILDALGTDPVLGWLNKLGDGVSEPSKIQEWRKKIDASGKDACVVSLHKLSPAELKIKGNRSIGTACLKIGF